MTLSPVVKSRISSGATDCRSRQPARHRTRIDRRSLPAKRLPEHDQARGPVPVNRFARNAEAIGERTEPFALADAADQDFGFDGDEVSGKDLEQEKQKIGSKGNERERQRECET